MADQSDVETALAGLVGLALYPQGTAAPSVTGRLCRIYRGWPTTAALDADLAAGNVNVTVFSEAHGQANTTRWPADWTLTGTATPSLTVAVAGDTATLGGSAAAGQLVGLLVDNLAVVHRTVAGDTPAGVAAILASYIARERIATAEAATITVPGAGELIGRVFADQPAQQESRRQRQSFRLTCWCPDPATRDATAAAIDGIFAVTPFIALADGLSGRLRFVASQVFDQTQDAALYRRDLVYSVDYATTVSSLLPSMIFGNATLAPDGGALAQSLLS